MYASITYSANATKSNVFNDIIALATGTVNTASLSSDVIQAGSQIISQTSAGWTLHQTLVAGSEAILSAPISDDGASSKFMLISTTLYGIVAELYEELDTPLTIVKGRRSGNTTDYHYPNTSTSFKNYIWKVGTETAHQTKLMISASANHFCANTLYGESYSRQSGAFILSEATRDSAWDTVANGTNPTYITGSNVDDTMYDSGRLTLTNPLLRASVYDGAGGIITSSSSTALTSMIFRTPFVSHDTLTAMSSSGGLTNVMDSTGTYTDALVPFGAWGPSRGNLGGNISQKSNVYMARLISAGSNDDVYVHNANNYRVWHIPGSSDLVSDSNSINFGMAFLVREV